MKKTADKAKAVIYCRVSSDKQVRDGSGLQSQENNCREYAKRQGMKVVKVFHDYGVSGRLGPNERPAAKELFAFLDAQKEQFSVIVDNVDRLTRSHEAYAEFCVHLNMRGAALCSPHHKFGDQPDERLVTNVMVSMATYQREANRVQVINRQTARLMMGYWPFRAPTGYSSVKSVHGGKILQPSEPLASIISEAFEGFASGRFESQTDVTHFLNKSGALRNKIYPTAVKSMLINPIYAGYIEYPDWDIDRRDGQHPAIISPSTFLRVQERLGRKAKAPYRKDNTPDFPLRGFALCGCCKHPLTAGWSTSRTKIKHPYYRCKTKGCPEYSKGLRRDLVHGEMESLLRSMSPSAPVISLLREIVADSWAERKNRHSKRLVEAESQIDTLDDEIRLLMEKCLRASDPDLINLYENHLKDLKLRKDSALQASADLGGIDTSFDAALGTILDFISNPSAMWTGGDLEDQRLVLKIAFADRLPFDKNDGFGTAGMSLPFSLLRGLSPGEYEMVAVRTPSYELFENSHPVVFKQPKCSDVLRTAYP